MKKVKTKIKRSREDLIFDIVTYIVLGLFLVIIAYPLYFILIASFSDPSNVTNGRVILFPKDLTLNGYEKVFSNPEIWSGYMNTFLYTVVGTTVNIFLTMGLAYPLSRKYYSGRKSLLFYLMFTMYFGGGMIPTFLLVDSLHLVNTFWVMVILGAVNVFNVIITKSFLEINIPSELEEAAMMDGCNQLQFFFKMVFPLSGAIMAVLVLYYGIGHWNDYMKGLIYLQDADKYPLQLIIRGILISTELEPTDLMDLATMDEKIKAVELVKYASIVVASVPMLVLYPFLQKHFNKGVMIGSLKG